MKVFIPARSETYAEAFKKRHEFIEPENMVFLFGQSSMFEIINHIIESEDEPVLLVHDDVYFDADFIDRVNMVIDVLNTRGAWGIAGNAGISCLYTGFLGARILKYAVDPHGGPNFVSGFFPAETIDGNVMLLNIPLLKEKNVRVPDFSGFHLYDICLSIESIKAGLAVYITDYLLVYHASRGDQKAFDAAKSQTCFTEYFNGTLSNTQIETINGPLDNSVAFGSLDLEKTALRLAVPQNYCPHVKIVVRTQFKRNILLKRCLDSIIDFIDVPGNTIFSFAILTDNKDYKKYILDGTEVLYFPNELPDSRLYLVQQAVKSIESEYIWFVDDDYWLFPELSEYLSAIIRCSPENATFYLGLKHFKENNTDLPHRETAHLSYEVPGKYYNQACFFNSVSCINHIPLSCAIFPRKNIKNRLGDIESGGNKAAADDAAILMHNMLSEQLIPILVPRIFVGAILRKSDRTDTESDRTKRNIAKAAAAYGITKCSNAFLLSMDSTAFGADAHSVTPKYGVKTALILCINKRFPWFGSKTASEIPPEDRTVGLKNAIVIWLRNVLT